jgi:alkylation response protein AidB-like acyl-CoA dehydrogenase
MNFDLTPEQRAIRESVREWAQRELAPRAYELDRDGAFPAELYQKCNRDLSVASIPFPERYGGMGLGMLDMSLVIEELARVDQSFALTLMVSVALGKMLETFGSEPQKERFLPGIAAGTAIAAGAGTEPQAGSWTAGFKTRAERRDGQWVINGEKAFITNCGTDLTSVIGVCAVTSPVDEPTAHMTMFLVPRGTPGMEIGASYDKLGWRSSDTHPIYFDNLRVGDDALLGTLGQGRYILHKGYHNGRILISALAVGLAQGCLDHTVAYAKEREAFGRRIGGFQLVQKMVADIAVKVETARLIARKAAWSYDSGTPDDYTMSISKYYCAEIASECADLAIQVHGGSGFMNECAPSRYWRDTRIVRIGDGTSQIQVLLIAKALGLDVDFG